MTHDDSGDVWLVSGHFRAVLGADLGERQVSLADTAIVH
jgi:hypothetical protein